MRKVYIMEEPGAALRMIADGLLEVSRQGVEARASKGEQIDDVEIAQVEHQVELLEALLVARRRELEGRRKSEALRAEFEASKGTH